MYHADLLGGLATRLAGISALAWGIRNSNLDRDKTKWTTRAVVGLCATISRTLPLRILSCSEEARRAHVAIGYAAEKMCVVPNGFDLARFQPNAEVRREVRSELGLTEETPLVGLMGRFDPQKNHEGFIAAASELHRQMPQVHFLLAGRGIDPGNQMLMSAIDRAGVTANTHLLGFRDDMPRVMAALDVLASSSNGEAFPNVLGEAMACGVTCAVTDVGDSAYIVGDTGRVVAAGDMSGLAASLGALLCLTITERAALGQRARARVQSHFEIGRVVRMYEQFYESLGAASH
jgi:glycosyltransferase involved in cell wall biosynthesis